MQFAGQVNVPGRSEQPVPFTGNGLAGDAGPADTGCAIETGRSGAGIFQVFRIRIGCRRSQVEHLEGPELDVNVATPAQDLPLVGGELRRRNPADRRSAGCLLQTVEKK